MTAPLRLLTGFRVAFVTAALGAAVLLAAPVSADTLDDYNTANDQLELLLTERTSLEASISSAMSAERASLETLTEAETNLARLLSDRRANDARLAAAAQRLAEAEAEVPALDEQAAHIERRIEAQERWLLDGETPRATSMRGYRVALDALDQLSGSRDTALRSLGAIHVDQASAVLDLGRLNTEITFWERQADTLSRQVGSLRARALGSHARLAEVQKTGLELAAQVQEQLETLRRLGHPVGAALVSDGLPPVPEPLTWPVAPPRGYVLPSGVSASVLRASEPLQLDRTQVLRLVLPAAELILPVKGIVTTPFGEATPYQPAHWAVDLGARLYEPVRAAADGVVEFTGLAVGDNRLASYGMVIVVRHGDRLTSLYAHLDDRTYGAAVKSGDVVQKGQVLGYVGLTGNTTGPHVHFEVRLDGQPLDPLLLVSP